MVRGRTEHTPGFTVRALGMASHAHNSWVFRMGPECVKVAFGFAEVLTAKTDIVPSRGRESGLTSLFATRRGVHFLLNRI